MRYTTVCLILARAIWDLADQGLSADYRHQETKVILQSTFWQENRHTGTNKEKVYGIVKHFIEYLIPMSWNCTFGSRFIYRYLFIDIFFYKCTFYGWSMPGQRTAQPCTRCSRVENRKFVLKHYNFKVSLKNIFIDFIIHLLKILFHF